MCTFEQYNEIAIPKGGNRELVEQWLTVEGIEVPEFAESRLHRSTG